MPLMPDPPMPTKWIFLTLCFMVPPTGRPEEAQALSGERSELESPPSSGRGTGRRSWILPCEGHAGTRCKGGGIGFRQRPRLLGHLQQLGARQTAQVGQALRRQLALGQQDRGPGGGQEARVAGLVV